MAKPLILTRSGKTIGPIGKGDQVDVVASPFTAELGKRGLKVVATQPGLLWAKAHFDYEFPFSESSFERVDSGRSTGKAAAGAIAGALIAGPLGLLAGAALGSGKKYVVAVRHAEASLVVELNASELQVLIGRGLLS